MRGVTTARGWQARLNWSKGVIDLDQTRRAADALRSRFGIPGFDVALVLGSGWAQAAE